ncbi:MAG: hypothetical protein QM784_10810 [Polyangiaceae bacterium]
MTNPSTYTGNKYFVDLSGSAPATPVIFETGGVMYYSHRFISPTMFVWLDANYAITYTQLSANGTWQAKTKTTGACGGGSITDSRPSGLIMCTVPAKIGAMLLYDIGTGTTSPLFWGSFSYDYTMVVDYFNSSTGDHNTTGILKLVSTNKPIFSSIDSSAHAPARSGPTPARACLRSQRAP